MLSSQPPAVQEAIAHFGLKIARVEAVQESFGSVVRILTLESGERLVLKIPYVRYKLLREWHALQHLQASLPVPRVLDVWLREDEVPGALLLSLLPGRVLSGAVSLELASALGSLLGRLHAHRLDRYGDVHETGQVSSKGWWAIIRHSFEMWNPLCAQVMPADRYCQTLDRYDDLYARLPEPDGPRWVHFDYRPGNILVEGVHITGLLDFESARGGSSGLDFVKMQNEVWDVWPGTREAFLQGYGSVRPVPDLEGTLPFYTLHNAFGGIAWCVKRASVDDPFFSESMQQLERALSRH